jgi:ketosteroid isomerase-like protein
MSVASALLERHLQTIMNDPARWQSIISEHIIWEQPFASALGSPTRLSGRIEAIRHAQRLAETFETYKFQRPRIYVTTDPELAIAEAEAQGRMRATGRIFQQTHVLFLRSALGRIAFIREYFDPTRAAEALDVPLLTLENGH